MLKLKYFQLVRKNVTEPSFYKVEHSEFVSASPFPGGGGWYEKVAEAKKPIETPGFTIRPGEKFIIIA